MSFYEGFFKALLKRKNSTLIQPITQCKQCLTDIGFIKFECYNETININDYDRPSYSKPIASIRQWDQITIRYVKRELIHFYKLCRACPILYLFHNIEKDVVGFLKERQNRIDEEFIKLHNRFITYRIPFNRQQLSRNLFHINLAQYMKPIPFLIDRLMEHNSLPKDTCLIIYSYWII